MDTFSPVSGSSSSSTILFQSQPCMEKNGRRHRPSFVTSASRRDSHNDRESWGKMVDEDMIVLRKRIHEKKMEERKYEPPSEWMEWEKRYYTRYNSDICEAVGMLQVLLMSTRPSVALGVLALVGMSLSVSVAATAVRLVEGASVFLSAGLHLVR